MQRPNKYHAIAGRVASRPKIIAGTFDIRPRIH